MSKRIIIYVSEQAEVIDMTEFLENTLNIVKDEVWNVNEAILFAIIIVVGLIVLVLIKNVVGEFFRKYGPGRKKTIFSHRKNQYKTRIAKGKKKNY